MTQYCDYCEENQRLVSFNRLLLLINFSCEIHANDRAYITFLTFVLLIVAIKQVILLNVSVYNLFYVTTPELNYLFLHFKFIVSQWVIRNAPLLVKGITVYKVKLQFFFIFSFPFAPTFLKVVSADYDNFIHYTLEILFLPFNSPAVTVLLGVVQEPKHRYQRSFVLSPMVNEEKSSPFSP